MVSVTIRVRVRVRVRVGVRVSVSVRVKGWRVDGVSELELDKGEGWCNG